MVIAAMAADCDRGVSQGFTAASRTPARGLRLMKRPQRPLVVLLVAVLASGGHVVCNARDGSQSFIPAHRRRASVPGRAAGVGALLAAAAAPAPASASGLQMPRLGDFFVTAIKSAMGYGEKTYDPYTEEGAKALGLAYPLPQDLGNIDAFDVVPFLLFFGLLCVWGLLVVPSAMDRSDGAKSVLFPSQVPKLKVFVPDEIKALPPEAPILNQRRFKDPDADKMLLPQKKAKKSKRGEGFKTTRTK
eukprot:TRINITY_DN95638_c0_g1_i1.p1 TRINITY_DN95638_c0_g1~~TRINITY_DN95638_c0_g1_i1.p1  ORF type:complete len:246 (+),score=52.68 TRINITY_DN95638_c0_g1_i1:79-816(+)